MHPGFWGYWHARQRARAASGPGGERGAWRAGAEGCAGAHCGGGGAARGVSRGGPPEWFAAGGEEGGGFGVRRPLRFLAHKLELNDEQVAQLATILSTLKTERAQAAVDQRRRTTALAAAFERAEFDAAQVDAAEAEQARSAERLRQSVKSALSEIHALLDDTQRKKFAYLLRTGVLSV